ncbi:hypothetical protein CL621_01335 [archaeon]|nr:hypothetical protein [archaeon]|tara:strand:+ start:1002 stop:1751 length:750 start_codon:yes stop_codon:yes gene_type:complete
MKLLDDAMDDLIREMMGEDAVSLINLIKKKSNVSEFKIAEKLNLGINQVRNVLYKLHAHNLIDSIRKKDKKKGWYIYYWTFNLDRAYELLVENIKKKIEDLKNSINILGREKFFFCDNDSITFSFENAMEHNFKCPECGEVLVQKENKKEIDKKRNQIRKLSIELGEIEIELEKIRKREEAKKLRKKPKKKKKTTKKKKVKKKTSKKKKSKKKKPAKKKTTKKKKTKKSKKKSVKKKTSRKKKSRRRTK